VAPDRPRNGDSWKEANARGHFPTEQAALKCVYLAIMSLDPIGKGRKRWSNRWKEALNAFEITFDGRGLCVGWVGDGETLNHLVWSRRGSLRRVEETPDRGDGGAG
jgi:hypothetical protein